jgi:hypothetical protein
MAHNKPRNAQEALQQAVRLERAKQLIEEGYTFTKDADTNMVAVCKPGELHAAYWIGEHVDGTNGCDCPDAVKGNYCKHEICWDMIQANAQQALPLTDADEAAMWEAQCKKHDEENEELPEFDATRILLLAELRRAERGAKQAAGTAAEAGWNEKLRKCEAALQMYDEVKVKQAIQFYQRVPADPMNFPAH